MHKLLFFAFGISLAYSCPDGAFFCFTPRYGSTLFVPSEKFSWTLFESTRSIDVDKKSISLVLCI